MIEEVNLVRGLIVSFAGLGGGLALTLAFYYGRVIRFERRKVGRLLAWHVATIGTGYALIVYAIVVGMIARQRYRQPLEWNLAGPLLIGTALMAVALMIVLRVLSRRRPWR